MWDISFANASLLLVSATWAIAAVGVLAWAITRDSSRAPDPMETVLRRYASGEISRDEFDQFKRDLSASEVAQSASAKGIPKGPFALPVVLGLGVLVLAGTVAFAATGIIAGWDGSTDAMSRMMRDMMGGGMMGRSTADAPLTTGSPTAAISIRGFAFSPGNLQVPVGATVTWTNGDDVPHTATATDGSWDTGTLDKGQKKSITSRVPVSTSTTAEFIPPCRRASWSGEDQGPLGVN